jgi:AP-5 complex subunit beta-1
MEENDWFRIMSAFRWSEESRLEALKGIPVDLFVERVLMALMSERDEMLKINLLVFVQEQIDFLLDQEGVAREVERNATLKKICAALEVVLDTPVDGTAVTFSLKSQVCANGNAIFMSIANKSSFSLSEYSQVLVTTTAILISVRALETRPSLFESFVEVLMGIIRAVNSSADRLMRAMACECLRELEMTYPG